MFIFTIITAVLLVIIVTFFTTQVVIPSLTQRKMFPMFRETGKLEEVKIDELEKQAVEKQKQEINSINQEKK